MTDNKQRATDVIAWGDDPRPATVGGEWRANLTERIAAALDAAEARGRESVGLADFLPDPCGNEHRARASYIAETYGDWLACSRRRGHGDDHEHEDSGVTWAAS